MAIEPLVDGHVRRIADLRVSVTRPLATSAASTALPATGCPWLEREARSALRGDRADRGAAAAMGVTDVRLTGATRSCAADFPRLAAMLAPLVEDLSVTTNGYPARARRRGPRAAGVSPSNVSIDSLQPTASSR